MLKLDSIVDICWICFVAVTSVYKDHPGDIHRLSEVFSVYYIMLLYMGNIARKGSVLFNDALNTFYLRLYGRKEGNVLFNDALNTFYLRLYGRKEGNVLFNDALNSFYLRLYGITHMVEDQSDSDRGNLLPPHRLLFPISSKSSFICIIPQTG